MTNDEAQELTMLRKLIKRELATTQRFHEAMRSITAALTVNDLDVIYRVLSELGCRTPAPREVNLGHHRNS